jgi:hypothetical protein
MKLGKEEIQKIALGGLMLIGIVYVYFNMLLGPLTQRQEITRKSIADLEPQIAAAQAQINKTAGLEATAPQADTTVAQVNAMIPEGSPVAWFPVKMSDFFKRQGLDKTATRMNNEYEDKSLVGFRRISWSVDLPRIDFVPFAAALAQLENEEPLVAIGGLQIDTNRDDAEVQHILLTVHNLVKQ